MIYYFIGCIIFIISQIIFVKVICKEKWVSIHIVDAIISSLLSWAGVLLIIFSTGVYILHKKNKK